jgi:hypothetical protein
MNVFFPNREVTMIQLMNLTLALLVVILSLIDRQSGAHMAALVGTVIFALTLIPARLLGLKWLKRAESDLLSIARNGKWLGIWTFVWFLLYASEAMPVYYGHYFGAAEFVQRETVLLTASLVILAGLLALSNKWSYAHIKWWKQINMLIWLTVPFLFTHFVLAANIFKQGSAFLPELIILGLAAVAGVGGLLRGKRDYFAFWRVYILAVAVFFSVLAVLYYPAIL